MQGLASAVASTRPSSLARYGLMVYKAGLGKLGLKTHKNVSRKSVDVFSFFLRNLLFQAEKILETSTCIK